MWLKLPDAGFVNLSRVEHIVFHNNGRAQIYFDHINDYIWVNDKDDVAKLSQRMELLAIKGGACVCFECGHLQPATPINSLSVPFVSNEQVQTGVGDGVTLE